MEEFSDIDLKHVFIGVMCGLMIIGGCAYAEFGNIKRFNEKNAQCMKKCAPNNGGAHYNSCICDLTKVVK